MLKVASIPVAVGDYQPYSANLASFATVAPSANVLTLLGAASFAAFKTSLSLENVTNTSDANKPVSTAQQTALNLKANLASPTFTGTVSGSNFAFARGTITDSDPATLTQTWNDAADTFTAFQIAVTDTSSAAASLLANLTVGGVSKFSVRKDGLVVADTVTAYVVRTNYLNDAANVVTHLDLSDSGALRLGAAMFRLNGTTSSFPALKRSTTVIQARLADDSGFASYQAQLYRDTSGVQVVSTQGAAVADATDAATAITQLNALLARVRTHGLIAT